MFGHLKTLIYLDFIRMMNYFVFLYNGHVMPNRNSSLLIKQTCKLVLLQFSLHNVHRLPQLQTSPSIA